MNERTRECPSCAIKSSRDEEVCPYCGYEFLELTASRKWVAWLMAILLIWPLIKLIDLLF